MNTRALLEVTDLEVRFGRDTRWTSPVRAVNGVTLSVAPGEMLGIVGESGSGKSTLARAILRLVPASAGSIRFGGEDLLALGPRDLRRQRRRMQMVFQDPYASLDPSMLVEHSIAEPLDVHGIASEKGVARADRREWRRSQVLELLDIVGLTAEHARRYPYEFSGGQRQRIAIARSLAVRPELLVCDEPVSALDVSTQNQVINLLSDLRETFGIATLFIAHDLTVVRHISDRIAVMYLGRVVEEGPADRVADEPAHPYTAALLSAVPLPTRRNRPNRIVLTGDIPDPTQTPRGCAFNSRCPHVMDICRTVEPETIAVPGGGTVACHLYDTGAATLKKAVTHVPSPTRS